MLNIQKLKIAQSRSGLKKIDAARRLGISASAYCCKSAGKSEFTLSEITKLKEILELRTDEFNSIFFED